MSCFGVYSKSSYLVIPAIDNRLQCHQSIVKGTITHNTKYPKQARFHTMYFTVLILFGLSFRGSQFDCSPIDLLPKCNVLNQIKIISLFNLLRSVITLFPLVTKR